MRSFVFFAVDQDCIIEFACPPEVMFLSWGGPFSAVLLSCGEEEEEAAAAPTFTILFIYSLSHSIVGNT